MPDNLSPIDTAKFAAAKRASEFVEPGMKVGLGTGSTAAWLVKCLGERVRDEGLKIIAVPTSDRTAELAREVGIKVVSLTEARWLDLTIDGADEFDADLSLIKGGGGAHLQEKIVATASDRMMLIADASKRVEMLGKFPLPVEVIPFGWQASQVLIEETLIGLGMDGQKTTLRMNNDKPFVTDEGNHVLDLHLNRIENPRQLSMILNQIPGIVENGLFIDICDAVVIGYGDGNAVVEELDAPDAESDAANDADGNIFRDPT